MSLAGNFGQPWVLTTKDLQEATHMAGPMSLMHRKPTDSQMAFAAYGVPRNAAFWSPDSLQQRGGKFAFEGRTQDPRTHWCIDSRKMGTHRIAEDRQEPKQYYRSRE